jgi:AcrR family transcriptional regulator
MKIDVQPAQKPSKRGRPLSFDREQALENAMHVFWERGYEAASISELTAAMGITPPSLYAAFGDKEKLFLEAIERYSCGPGAALPLAMTEEPTARQGIERLMMEAAAELTRPGHPSGCMVVTAATNCSAGSAHIQQALARRRADLEDMLRRCIEQDQARGAVPAGTDVAALAAFYATVYQGMSIQARDGATRDNLEATARTAMMAWPRS